MKNNSDRVENQMSEYKETERMPAYKLDFSPLTIEDQVWIKEKLAADGRAACEYSFASNYAWSPYYGLSVAKCGACGVFRYTARGCETYSFPFGGSEWEKKEVLECLLKHCEKEEKTLKLSPLTQADRECLQRMYPGQFLIRADRDSSDYIYEREKLVKLPGKKYHGKRNHIARFKDADDWCYEAITEDNMEDVLQMMQEWKARRADVWSTELEQEYGAMSRAMSEMKHLGLLGGLLRKAGSVVARALGEPLNKDTFVVHYEKAFADVQGAYPMINQQFAEHVAEGYLYINREEDTGDAGLRKAKLSYQPYRLETKYMAEKSDVVFVDFSDEKQKKAFCELWRDCFSDGDFSEFFVQERAAKDVFEQISLVIYRDGKPVSMASFLPAVYHTKEEEIPVRYVYAVGTNPAYRGQGLAAQIIRYAQQLWDEPLVLSPASEGLYRYYEKQGFVRCFRGESVGRYLQKPESCRWNFRLEQADAASYAVRRDEYLAANRQAYLRWDAQAIAFAFTANERDGGKNLFLIPDAVSEQKELLMYTTEGKCLIVLETTLCEELLECVLPELMAESGTTEVRYEIPGGMMLLSKNREKMTLPSNGYLNLTLG